MLSLWAIISAILSISFVLVSIALVHEFGHYITAKLTGIWVLEFAIGFGNRIFKKQIGETLYSLRPLPLGGFVRLAGMDNIEEDEETEDEKGKEKEEEEVDEDLPLVPVDHPKSYVNKPRWAKMLVLSAGSIMNMVWAIVLFIGIYLIAGGPVSNISVVDVMEGRPAQEAGILPGDIITAINGEKLTDWSQGVGMIQRAGETEVVLSVSRNNPVPKSAAGGGILQNDIAVNSHSYEVHNQEILEIIVTPSGPVGSAQIGISLAPNQYDFQSLPTLVAIKRGVNDSLSIIGQTLTGLYRMFSRQTQADVAGPVKIMQMIKDRSAKGFVDLLYLTAILSINIGLINLLPLPVLDGGRIVFLLLEAIFSVINSISGLKLAITPKVEENIHFAGMIFLLSLLLFVTYKDIMSFF